MFAIGVKVIILFLVTTTLEAQAPYKRFTLIYFLFLGEKKLYLF